MTAQIGADGLDLFRGPRPQLLADVARVQPVPDGVWVNIEDWRPQSGRWGEPGRPGRPGFRSTQRLWISDVADGVAAATWPAEKASQARYLYGNGFGPDLVTTARERGWIVDPSPHIAYVNSPSSNRLYMRTSMAPLDYVACWEDEDALRRLRYDRKEDVEQELWPWLKQKGFTHNGDYAELQRFLKFLGGRQAHMRPGFRFRRVWTFAEVAELGSALGETICSEFDALFARAHEPPLSSVEIVRMEARKDVRARRERTQTASPGVSVPYREAQVNELPGNLEPFTVDPVLVERGRRGHVDTQNELARVLRNAGIEPRSPRRPEPDFDLAWQRNETVFVAEVKSVTTDNEEVQLRLGLGQVLRYRQRLSALGHSRVVAVLVPERQPHDPSWRGLCEELGVVLLGGNELEQALMLP